MRILLIILTSFLVMEAAGQPAIQKLKITELEKMVAAARTPLIINFWATFCKPCIEEIPYFQEEVKKRSGDSVQLLFVSLDLEEAYPAGIRNFAQKRKLAYPIAWLDEFDADYFCPKIDSSWSGAIPATLFINNTTGYRKFYEQQLSRPQLIAEINALLTQKP